jgi:hypothetical protein
MPKDQPGTRVPTRLLLCLFMAFALTPLARAADETPSEPPRPDKATKEFYHDFRDKNFPNTNFKLAGKEADKRIKSEPDGLRITLPGEEKGTVGIATQFNIQGDFEVTVGYEIIKLDKPEGGVGAGLEFYLMTGSPTKESLSYGRKVRPDGSDVYTGTRKGANKKGKRVFVPGQGMNDIPAIGKIGYLRLTRIGPTAFLSASEGTGKAFRVLHRTDLGADEITLLRLAAHPGDFATPIDLRLTDFRARAENLGEVVDTSPPPRGTALWLVLALLAALLLMGGFLIWWMRKRKAQTPPEIEPDGSAETVAGESDIR